MTTPSPTTKIVAIRAISLTVPAPMIQTLSPNLPPIFHTHTLRLGSIRTANRTLRISCTKETENPSGELLAAELSQVITKLSTETAQREDAFKKSRELLFAEVSDFVRLKPEDLKKKWRRMDDGEKLVLVKGFVAEWSAQFHPLSARSVKELVEEHVGGSDGLSESTPSFLPDCRKLFDFDGNWDSHE